MPLIVDTEPDEPDEPEKSGPEGVAEKEKETELGVEVSRAEHLSLCMNDAHLTRPNPFHLYTVNGQSVFEVRELQAVGNVNKEVVKYVAYLVATVRGDFFKYCFEVPDTDNLETLSGAAAKAVIDFENFLFKPQHEIKARVG